jgi:signal peptidase II
MSNQKKFFFMLLLSGFTLFLDLTSKYIVQQEYPILVNGINIFSGFNLVYVENRGISFGLLSDFDISPVLGIISFIISFYIIYLVLQSNKILEVIGLSLVLGGAIGNGYDRVSQGYVIDFLDFYIGKNHWPAFNLADTFISVGAVIFFLSLFIKESKTN